MSRFTSPLRKIGVGVLAAATLAGSIAATTASADARPYHRGGYHHHRGGGWVGPAIIGGVAAGLLAAPLYGHYGNRCWTERQEVVDRYGRVYLRPVRVCG